MENQIQESTPSQSKRRLESPQHQNDNVSAQSPKRSRNANRSPPSSLPQDMIFGILPNLPVKSLLRFRCVSKSLEAFITDPSFIKKHLKTNQKDPKCSRKRVLITSAYLYSVNSCFLKAVYEDSIVNTTEIDYLLNKTDGGLIVGSCNGLICMSSLEGRITLFNPSLRVFKWLPDLEFKERKGNTTYGFGFDASVDDYKVVIVHRNFTHDGHEVPVFVYSLKTNCWRRILQEFPSGMPAMNHENKSFPGKHVDGSLNWLVFHRQDRVPSCTIISLDLAQETFKELILPFNDVGAPSKRRQLGVLDGCLCVISDFGSLYAEVWVMKEYGKCESYIKMVTIPYISFPGVEFFSELWYSAPLFVSESGEILLRFGRKLMIYNPKVNMFRVAEVPPFSYSRVGRKLIIYNPKDMFRESELRRDDRCYIRQVEVYEESLVSPIVVDQDG